MMGQAVSLGWIGHWATVLCRRRSILERPGESQGPDDLGKFLEKNLGRLPVAVRIDANNPLKLAAFLATARAFIEQTSSGTDALGIAEVQGPAVCPHYAGQGQAGHSPRNGKPRHLLHDLGGALTVTLSEKLLDGLHRSLRLPKIRPRPTGKPAQQGSQAVAWLECRLASQPQDFGRRQCVFRDQYQQTMQTRCWANLPILNEWKRLYPGRDPVEVHQGGLGRGTGLSGRRQVCLEREISHDGIDCLRSSGRAEGRPTRPAGAEQLCQRRFRPDV